MSSANDANEEKETRVKVETDKYYCNTCGMELLIGQYCPNCSPSLLPQIINPEKPLVHV